ncbi:MAG: hypothetical protein GX654_21035 [Desulfatiglans sp.]|jgi:hypothetical protein|nr:hypothetical protein [Desulfatiglans sp.]
MNNKNDSIEIFEILEKIASQFNKESKEYQAIEKASWALHFIRQEEVAARFEKFINDVNRPLTKEQINHMHSMGILSDESSKTKNNGNLFQRQEY